MSILELIPAPAAYEGRSLGEVNGVVQEGNSDVVVYDTVIFLNFSKRNDLIHKFYDQTGHGCLSDYLC